MNLARHSIVVTVASVGVFGVIGIIGIMACRPAPVAAQGPASVRSAAPGGTTQTADAARTSWGDPDLRGIWTNSSITPFERPAALADTAVLTAEQAATLEAETAQQRAALDADVEAFASYNNFWFDPATKVLSSRQTSLVVDPVDGRVPFKPEAEAIRDDNLANGTDSYERMSVWDRCITRGVPGSMFPAGYNNGYQILQTPEYVVILYEMIHDARVIPIDDHPHVGSDIRLWMGDSRGRWDGHTLVVDTTNFNGRGWIAPGGAGGRINGIPLSESLHVVERFTRLDADTIQYVVTVEDPEMYTSQWTVAMPLTRDQDYQIFEYACHEGNTSMENVLRGGRAQDVPAPPQP